MCEESIRTKQILFDSITLAYTPFGVLQKSQAFLCMANGLIAISAPYPDIKISQRAIYKAIYFRMKNWLFSNTSKSTRASAIIYSIIEIAKDNSLVVEKYLVYLIDVIFSLDTNSPDMLLKVMPWCKELPDYLKLQRKKN